MLDIFRPASAEEVAQRQKSSQYSGAVWTANFTPPTGDLLAEALNDLARAMSARLDQEMLDIFVNGHWEKHGR